MYRKLGVGDVVYRKSYEKDVYFKIEEIFRNDAGEEIAKLRGLGVRLCADSPLGDLEQVGKDGLKAYRIRFVKRNNEHFKKIMARHIKTRALATQPDKDDGEKNFFELPGQVLHIDGSADYLKLCLEIYSQLSIKANGVNVSEKDQPSVVPELLSQFSPDILVLTGHDGIIKSSERYSDINNYHNSRFFVEAVREARKVQGSKDELIIFAGACQSYYEAIISAGANYASSPKRVLIHAFDPVYIVEKIAFTPVNFVVSTQEVIDNTITGIDGLGGIDTWGKHRKGFPKSPYQSQTIGLSNIME